MAWEVRTTEVFDEWFLGLDSDDRDDLEVVVDLLVERGPTLGRPYADSLAHTRIHRLKELRSATLRVIFAFDPSRAAVLLLGGDKAGQWEKWYRRAIPQAEQLYREHLRDTGQED